jgi:hypothetical protein
VLLVNPEETGGPVHFVVEGVIHTLQPGEQHLLGSGGTWKVEFDRGNNFGDALHVVDFGTWRFQVGDQGWALVPPPLVSAEAPLDEWLD